MQSDAPKRTGEAVEAARLRWAQRRADLVKQLGEAAFEFVERARRAQGRGSQSLMVAAGIAIDKAQLLDGGATGRVEHMRPEEAARELHKLRDELAARREAKQPVG